ncbi:hypothetical protein BC835DRAFT_858206 [Cytidiella melzeri]|nr:hypothetical protein BC835DRAFT_858206 [Cytidiella melzeri]
MRFFTIVALALFTINGFAVSAPIRISPAGTSAMAASRKDVDDSGAMQHAVLAREMPGMLSKSGGQVPSAQSTRRGDSARFAELLDRYPRELPPSIEHIEEPTSLELTRQRTPPPAYGVGEPPEYQDNEQPPAYSSGRTPANKWTSMALDAAPRVAGVAIIGGVGGLFAWAAHQKSNSDSHSDSTQ